jgi:hypothetical protein
MDHADMNELYKTVSNAGELVDTDHGSILPPNSKVVMMRCYIGYSDASDSD